MRIAIAGKGGTGKTTIAGTLARAWARTGREVLAIDADTNPNLASVLGIAPERAADVVTLPRNVMQRQTNEDGTTQVVFTADPEALIEEYAIRGPDGVLLMVMGKVGHSGAGCLCSAHATVRGFLGEVVVRAESDRHIVVDMEAGLEHLSRGTGRHVGRLVAVLEPYYRSMETARNIVALAAELAIPDIVVVANKVRDEADRSAIADFCRAHDMHLVGEVPFDAGLADVERAGGAPIDRAPQTPAVVAIERLARMLAENVAVERMPIAG
ncbi:MAG: AAA family ATPase [Gemmatimonadota bacterium]|nr:AAA family ATPase [Gemmatimonadota bacterium]